MTRRKTVSGHDQLLERTTNGKFVEICKKQVKVRKIWMVKLGGRETLYYQKRKHPA